MSQLLVSLLCKLSFTVTSNADGIAAVADVRRCCWLWGPICCLLPWCFFLPILLPPTSLLLLMSLVLLAFFLLKTFWLSLLVICYYSVRCWCYCPFAFGVPALCFCIPLHHKVRIYKEYHSVCPLVGIGTPPPLSRKRVFPSPPEPKGGGDTRLRVRGGWSQFRWLEKKLSTLPTLCPTP